MGLKLSQDFFKHLAISERHSFVGINSEVQTALLFFTVTAALAGAGVPCGKSNCRRKICAMSLMSVTWEPWKR